MGADAELTVLREIADGAQVDPTARIGEFCTIGPHVTIGPRTVLARRVAITGRTTLGADNVIHDGTVLGESPQDLKFYGRDTYLMIGDRNVLGPNVTAHVGTEMGGYLTRIGDDNLIDGSVHIAHDCYVDDGTRLEAGVLLAGHVRVETGATIKEITGAHHFTTIGQYSRVGARTPVRRDVPPFTYFSSRGYYTIPPTVLGVNEEGLDRAGLCEADKDELRRRIGHLFGEEDALRIKLGRIAVETSCQAVRYLCEFCRRSLDGAFGRCREAHRGRIPPEASQYLPADVLARIEGDDTS